MHRSIVAALRRLTQERVEARNVFDLGD